VETHAVPVTPPIVVVACYLRYPLRVAGRVAYRLVTSNQSDFISSKLPDIFDQAGQPVALTADLAPGSVVRVETDAAGAMVAVQLLKPLYRNPFARLMQQFLAALLSAFQARAPPLVFRRSTPVRFNNWVRKTQMSSLHFRPVVHLGDQL
jgi:hypothetical protein